MVYGFGDRTPRSSDVSDDGTTMASFSSPIAASPPLLMQAPSDPFFELPPDPRTVLHFPGTLTDQHLLQPPCHAAASRPTCCGRFFGQKSGLKDEIMISACCWLQVSIGAIKSHDSSLTVYIAHHVIINTIGTAKLATLANMLKVQGVIEEEAAPTPQISVVFDGSADGSEASYDSAGPMDMDGPETGEVSVPFF
jgi:hypothetical protein